MLKKSWYFPLQWAILCGLISMGAMASAEAALFDQEEVEADQFVAIAVPLPQGERHNLIVLEQKTDVRPCWEEDSQAGTIDPLLLTFDFSGICGRSTDSNGYSIRQVGEDLALKYRLSIQKNDGVLTLMGIPLQSSFGKPIEIGRTQSQAEGFLKITLNPDWKLTRRVYQGQALGHIYFTRDVIPPEPTIADIETTLEGKSQSSATELEETVNVEGTVAESNGAQPSLGEGLSGAKSASESSLVEPFDAPIQIPVPTPPLSQNSLNPSAQPQGFLNTVQPVADVKPSPMGPIPVPAIAPLGQVGASEPDVFSPTDLARLPDLASAGDAPPPPSFKVALSIRRYRVFVNATDAKHSDIINALAPDAFWTRHQGRRMLQMGAFLKQEKADIMVQALAQQGINATIDASHY